MPARSVTIRLLDRGEAIERILIIDAVSLEYACRRECDASAPDGT